MAAPRLQTERINENSPEHKEYRGHLAILLSRLFALWQIPTAIQLNLLGLSSNSRSLLSKYRNGHPLPAYRDVLVRAGYLLSIHKSLGLLYPKNEELKYSWVSRRNKLLENKTPLEIMTEQGIIGLAKIAKFLEYIISA
jgi:hypothetical protein